MRYENMDFESQQREVQNAIEFNKKFWRAVELRDAEDAELVAELRSRVEMAQGDRLAKLGTMLINLGSDVIAVMHERDVRAFIKEAPGREEEPEDDDSPKGHWTHPSFDPAPDEFLEADYEDRVSGDYEID